MNTTTASAAPAELDKYDIQLRKPTLGSRIGSGQAVHGEIMDFLIDEASMLDENRIADWFAVLTRDLVYTMPVRRMVSRKDGNGFDGRSFWFHDDYSTVEVRVNRLITSNACYAEDPPSFIRRFVSNLTLHETEVAGEYYARSYIYLVRNRGEHLRERISAVREDIIRRTDSGLRLAQRNILLDQSVGFFQNLSFFI